MEKNWIALRGRRGRFEHCSLVITHWKVLDGLYDLEINGLYSQILFLICKLLLTLREFTLLMQSVIAILGFASLVPTSATATISSIQSRTMSVGNHVFTGGSAVQPQLSVMPMRALQAEYR
jgi:hypothetical protein